MSLTAERSGTGWYLGNGDCLDDSALLALPDHSVDVLACDPPYSSGARRDAEKSVYGKTMNRNKVGKTGEEKAAEWFSSDSLTVNGFTWLMHACAIQWRRVLKPGGHALAFIDWRMLPQLAAAIESADLRHVGVLVWDKTYFGLGACFRNQYELILHFTNGQGRVPSRKNEGNVIACKPVRPKAAIHPTEKPISLLRRLLSVVGQPGDLVVDPFSGSGATGAAALSLGMRFVGFEREERYFKKAAARLDEMAALVSKGPIELCNSEMTKAVAEDPDAMARAAAEAIVENPSFSVLTDERIDAALSEGADVRRAAGG